MVTRAIKQRLTLLKHAPGIITVLALLVSGGFAGYLLGYHQGTGEYLPWFADTSYVMPGNTTEQTFEQVAEFVESDPTSEQPYDEGFNCVDFALALSYKARWAGLDARIAKLEYPEPPHHMLLAFPTSDRGLVFYETQTDEEVQPAPGKIYNGRRISAIYILAMDWIPIDTYLGGNTTCLRG